ncbi:unnamed protein product [Ceutorhynchus assimilis]|uniref:DUF7869 domain-containing protein n=1 Tax=Ceutorhynchus assimilis TaxID=467358 RepID=A0A9N9MIW6_9CUCU|nr:unnamed protein product [Ceutorhynchus assimilis]
MGSRGKLLVQLACKQFLQSSAENTVSEHNNSASTDYSGNGYIELSPVNFNITPRVEQEDNTEDSHYLSQNSDGNVLQNCLRRRSRNRFIESENDSIEDKNYEPESDTSSVSSNDSDINLQILKEKFTKCKADVKDNGVKKKNLEVPLAKTQKVDEDFEKKGRKRKRNIGKWKRNIRKDKRNKEEEYLSSKNKITPKRQMKSPCKEKCRFKCHSVFSEGERETIFNSFWAMGDNTRQRQYISSCMDILKPTYRYPKQDMNRSLNQAYFLVKNEEKVRVCKKFFMATLNIGDTMIRNIAKKRDQSFIVGSNMKGKHNNQPKLDSSLKQAVKDHINSIPRVESHYLRNQTKREYFEGSLNVSSLYRLYKEKCLNEGSAAYVKKSAYENIFNADFNIGFHKPKKDQCSTCETFRNSNEEDRKQIEKSHLKHLKDKDLSREEKAKDVQEAKTEKDKMVAVYDLEAVLPSPCGEISDFYYKSKLATYNFTVYDIAQKQGYCYVWSEHIAKRGANEIGSCVMYFLQQNAVGKSIVFYSDNCAGQNKNRFVAAMYLYAVSKFDIPEITHKFLVTGHTQNEGDSMHSCIEKEKKRVLRSGPIYVPAQWIPVIRLAKKNGNPYNVEELGTSDFYDFKQLSQEIGNNYGVNLKNEKVLWSQISVLNVSKNNPYMIKYKYSYDDLEYEAIDIRGRTSSRFIGAGNIYNNKTSTQARL